MSAHSVSGPCPYCEGTGCEECDQTGKRFVTTVGLEDATLTIHGSAELSAETIDALAVVARAAIERIDTERDA